MKGSEKLPKTEALVCGQPLIGYTLLRSLGKGGMGEVFLAADAITGRNVALKRIRPDLLNFQSMQDRFLREARIAAQLAHPSIMPIYAIHPERDGAYYTMPYVEGETLRQILRTTQEQEKKGAPLHPTGASIPTLARIFLNTCQAMAYAHAKGILHRDLKPENIIVGKYGEVLILDWGLADLIGQPEDNLEEITVANDLDSHNMSGRSITRPGKIVGTLNYMAPERALEEAASVQTDIYALGAILYQILTLQLPFQRSTLSAYRKIMQHERLIYPTEVAPYRDIPRHLADMAKKCLAYAKQERYASVQEMIAELESYIEGRPEWVFTSHLHIEQKHDWEFQENILLAKHIAITREVDVMEWVNMMVSKASFSGNTKLEAKVRLGPQSKGLGFLLSIPEAGERTGLEEGYCLWLGSPSHPGCKLFRSNVEVMNLPEIFLETANWYALRLEKSGNSLRFYFNDELKFNYICHLPLTGTHVGLLVRDDDFAIEDFKIFVGSQNVMVNCLAVPDAFLANKDYAKALTEYRRIGYSFAGRTEGREALFRSGITLLEEAQTKAKNTQRRALFQMALEEFGKLRSTPGAPLEYLGKALVYKATGDIAEEIKCLELAVRKFTKHPLLPILVEHIVFRLHESAFHDRLAAYHFTLLAVRHLAQIFANADNQKLIDSLKKNLEPLPFITPQDDLASLAIQLAFWIGKPLALVEIVEQNRGDERLAGDALFALLMLGCATWVEKNLDALPENCAVAKQLRLALSARQKGVKQAIQTFFAENQAPFSFAQERTLRYLYRSALDERKAERVSPHFSDLQIEALLWRKEWHKAGELLKAYPEEHFLKECWLRATRGKKNGVPPKSAISQLFFWEKVHLFRKLALFYHCAGQSKNGTLFQKKLKKELRSVRFAYPLA